MLSEEEGEKFKEEFEMRNKEQVTEIDGWFTMDQEQHHLLG